MGNNSKARLIATAIVVAVLIVAAFIGWGLWQSAQYEWQADSQSNHYAEHAGKQAHQACFGLTSAERPKCAAEASDKQSNYEYNQHDLVAQRQSALWGYVMAVAAAVGMGLSVIGVILVWTTFRETKQSNVLAQQHQRARLVPKIRFNQWPDGSGFDVVVSAENIGSTPATGVTLRCNIFTDAPATPHLMKLKAIGTSYGLMTLKTLRSLCEIPASLLGHSSRASLAMKPSLVDRIFPIFASRSARNNQPSDRPLALWLSLPFHTDGPPTHSAANDDSRHCSQ